jgi:excisionase family DNA binding protein
MRLFPPSLPGNETWLSLSDAAHLLGVHFATLRRWADAGQIPCARTVGGRRRFALSEVQRLLCRPLPQGPAPSIPWPVQAQATTLARQHIQSPAVAQEGWLARFTDGQRQQFRHLGQQLIALLFQSSARPQENAVFLADGERIGVAFGELCCAANLSLGETVRDFLLFQRLLLDATHEAASGQRPDIPETWAFYRRMSALLDHVLLVTVESHGRCRELPPDAA